MTAPQAAPQAANAESDDESLADQAQLKLLTAIEHHQQGRLVQARALYEEVIKIGPGHGHAHHLLGVIAAQSGNPHGAVDLIGKAIEMDPGNPALHANLGVALLQLARLDDALRSLDQAIALQPAYADAWYNRGNVLQEMNQNTLAVASHDQALILRPDYAAAWANRGNALRKLGQAEAALMSHEQAIALSPTDAALLSNRGVVLQELGRFEAALASHEQAIALQPDNAWAWSNRGSVLQELHQLAAALASHDRAIALQPDNASAHSNRANTLWQLKQLDAAMASHDQALALAPDDPNVQWNMAITALSAGKFDIGWPLYESRWKRDTFTSPRRNFAQALWLGKQDLAGKTILLYGEQGLGDTIQFCRYAPWVARLGARVIMEVPVSLAGLLKNLPGVAALIVQGESLPAFDHQCPLMSLPLAFETRLSSIPSPGKYLDCEPDKLARWSRTLGKKTRPRVGLVWSGSTTHRNDRRRSIPLAMLIRHLPARFEFISLQKEVRETDEPALRSTGAIVHCGDALTDFTETAALCAQMDLVICVDTSVAHLAGALGVPTWLLLPFTADWRWLPDRIDSPWYQSMKLYRQTTVDDWDGVLARLRVDLDRLS